MADPIFTDSEWTFPRLARAWEEIEKIGVGELGIDIYRNQFEVITAEQMLDAYTSIGMPIFYNHWSFGRDFARHWQGYKSGQSGLAYELVINSNPCINYLMEDNTMTMQTMVMAHAGIGHNSFFKNNYLFKTWTDAEGIVDYLVFARDYVAKVEQKEGREKVERFLDSCHALMDYGVDRYKRPSRLSIAKEKERQQEREAYLQTRVDELYRIIPQAQNATGAGAGSENDKRFPAQPEENLLYFFEKNAPLLKPWQRELIRITRKVSQYFYPQGQTKVANEGFASWSHHTIMTRLHEKGLLTDGAYLEFLSHHAGVLWQPNFDHRYYSGMNPYRLGFEILKDIERMCRAPTEEDLHWFPQLKGADSLEVIKDVVANYRDESFIRQYLSPHLIRDMRLFKVEDDRFQPYYEVKAIQDERGYIDVREGLAENHERESMLPRIEVMEVDRQNRMLHLCYTSPEQVRLLSDPTGMLKHINRLWTCPVALWDANGSLLGAIERYHDG